MVIVARCPLSSWIPTLEQSMHACCTNVEGLTCLSGPWWWTMCVFLVFISKRASFSPWRYSSHQ